MSVDKVVDSAQLDADLTSIANAIRTKGGTSASLAFPSGFVTAIGNISTGITPTGTKNITISSSGTTTEDVTNYASAAITVGAGTAGTPTATKGTVSNHSISVTPSVTNSAGYISGGTKTGTAVSVAASELVSGTYSVTSSGTKDVTNYASASVPAGTVTAPSTISGTSASVTTGADTLTLSKTVSVTPSVTTAGYVSSGTAGNAAVSLTASVPTKSAATYHPSTSDQSISSGTYLTGAQTIKGVSLTNLTADNIKSGVTVKIGDSTDDDCVASILGTYDGGGGGTDPLFYIGKNPVLLTGSGESYSGTIYLKDTAYATWSPSTTAKTIVSSGSTTLASVSITSSSLYDYIFKGTVDVNVAFNPGATLQSTSFRFLRVAILELRVYPGQYQNYINNVNSSGGVQSLSDIYQLFYYTSTGNATCSNVTYGPAYTTASVNFSVSGDNNTGLYTFNARLPTISARCNSSYFTTTRASEVDQNNTTIKFDYKFYRIDKGTGPNRTAYTMFSNAYNNPL